MKTLDRPTNFDISAYRILLGIEWNSNPYRAEIAYGKSSLVKYLPNRSIITDTPRCDGISQHFRAGVNEFHLGAGVDLDSFLKAEVFEGDVMVDDKGVYRLTPSGEEELFKLKRQVDPFFNIK